MFGKKIYKTPAQLRLMVAPGLATEASLTAVRAAIAPGITPLELDTIARDAIRAAGGEPNFPLVEGYSHTLCVSVNADVVHGIPSSRPLEPGDIVSVDSGAILGGWNGDSAMTVVVPDFADPEREARHRALSDITEGSMWAGIARLATATHLNEVGDAVQGYIEKNGNGHRYGILTDYIGHGIGRDMHEEPPVFNYRVRGKGPLVKPGLVVCIEPMIVRGSIDTVIQDDDWTVSTEDGESAAHWEHSVAVHERGIWVTTASDGGAAGLAAFGVVPVPIP